MGRFEQITSVLIDTPLGSSNDFYLSQESDSSSALQFEPGDVFGFFMPRTAGGGTVPSLQQCYSTNFTSDPSNTLYYMNVDGLFPSCVVSLCDPAMKMLSGVQLQINVSIGQ